MARTFLRPALTASLAATCALTSMAAWAGDKGMTGVPLAWTPTSTLAESVGPLNLLPLAGAKIWIQPFTDTRPDKAVVGENQEKSVPRAITTKDDVAAFLGEHMTSLYKEAGLPMAAKPGEATVLVSVEVLRCKVTEKDTYKGELSLMVEVKSGGKALWRGTVLGEATRWGRSFKLENYHEAICDSLMDAVGKSLKSDAFLKALATR
ncbi:MAG TPA: hypothetical protein VNV60_05930 [Holophagaceae bacterium]|jgi:hypothetical protein|nr:hypothetical protein [Holophagaceae bacterium]